MTALQAAEAVLAEAGAPLNYRVITRRVLQRGLWQTNGRTPDATIRSEIGTDIRRLGAASRFQRCGRGQFGLRQWSSPAPASQNERSDAGSGVTLAAVPKTRSFAAATEHVLDQFGGGRPMHYLDITQKVMQLGLVHTAGQTPERTLYTQVVAAIERDTRRGETPCFVRHGKGLFGLARWQQPGLAGEIDRHNSKVKKQLHAELLSMKWPDFETLAGRLLDALGFEEVTVTSPSADGGIDARGILVVGGVIRIRMAVQVKKLKKNVHSPTVQQVRGSLGTHDHGLIITTSDFSRGARDEAERPNAVPVALMNGEQLVALLVEHSIGVHRTSHYLLELGDAEDE